LHAEEFDHLVRLDLLRRQRSYRDVEVTADQGANQQQHRRARRHAEAQIRVPERAEHRENEHHANEQGDQNGEKTGRKRQVMKLADVHWCCSPLSATKLVRLQAISVRPRRREAT
jgi:hypothetical protein